MPSGQNVQKNPTSHQTEVFMLIFHEVCISKQCIKRGVNNEVWKLKKLQTHFILILDNDQRDAHLLYFTIYLSYSSTCFEHFVLIIRGMNCIDAASGIVLSISAHPVHRLGKNWLEWASAHSNQFFPNLCTGRPLTESTIPDAASIQLILLMMST